MRGLLGIAALITFSALAFPAFTLDGLGAIFNGGSANTSGAAIGAQSAQIRSPAQPGTTPAGSSLASIVASMAPGWHAIGNTRFRDVMPGKQQTEWGTVGPISVLIAWNNIAFDGKNLYAHGGGHSDYGGNEVYRFALANLKWERVIEPAPYPARILKDPDGTASKNPARCPAPVDGPPSTHTYDGKFVTDGRLWVSATGIAFCPSGVGEITHEGLWALDLGTKKWSRIDTPIGGLWLTAVLPNGTVFVATSSTDLVYDPRTGTIVQQQGGYGDEGEGSAVYDPKRNRIWLINRSATAYIPLTADFKLASRRTRVLPTKPGQSGQVGGIGFDGSTAIDPARGRLIRWGGGKHVVVYTPEADKWESYDFVTGPKGPGPLYDRMFPLPGHDGVFIAVGNNVDEDVWLLKLPNRPGLPVPLSSLQSVIDAAQPGGRVHFEPGIYNTGALITKPLTADFTGVTIASVREGKAAVVVRDTTGVVIENLKVCGLSGSGNVAAVKGEGAFDLTLRKLVSCENEMGLLTDNKGGRLVIEDSLFENMGRTNGDLGHLIYAGEIDELVLRNSIVRCSRNGGHVVKSRARKTLIERNVIAQANCETSRLIDLSAGGDNVIRSNVFQQGPESLNAEMIGTGLEIRSKQWAEQRTLIESNLFISDLIKRPGSSVPAVYKTREGHAVTTRGNRIVWTDGRMLRGKMGYIPGGFADIDGQNVEFIGRAAAGLPAYPDLPRPTR